MLCCAGKDCAASRAQPSLFHKLYILHRFRGCTQQNVGQCCISWAGVCFAVSVWFFHLGDNSYPMCDLCSVYFTTPCDNQIPALNFFTTKETRTLPRWLLTRHSAVLQPLLTCKTSKVCGDQGYTDDRTVIVFSPVWLEIRYLDTDMRYLVSGSSQKRSRHPTS